VSAEGCLDLAACLGHRYLIRYEESYLVQKIQADAPWLKIIPCRYGHIFPHGGTVLAASVDGRPKIAGTLRRLPCCRVHQDGDFGELTVIFDFVDFDQVAKIMRPHRRPQISEDQRVAMADRMRAINAVAD
jgi:hypothetical protein